jgi:tripartite-type tricarboxylate transporter receptor subunit TctC
VLENMPGGSGSVGTMAVARSAPDGHTLVLASNSFIVLAPLVISGNPVNVKRDLTPIALLFTFPFLLVVNAELGPKTLKNQSIRQGAVASSTGARQASAPAGTS